MSFRQPPRPARQRAMPQPVPEHLRRTDVRMVTPALLAEPPAPRAEPPRRASKPQRTEAQSAHIGRVKRLRCVLCVRLQMQQESPTDAHHPRSGQGGAQRASDWLVAALCHDRCHQGPHGIHGDRALLRQAKCTELDLTAWTLEALDKEARCPA